MHLVTFTFMLMAAGCGDSTYDLSNDDICGPYETAPTEVLTFAGRSVEDLLAQLGEGGATATTAEGEAVLVTSSFTATGPARQVDVAEAPERCEGLYPRLEVEGTWRVEAEGIFAVSWSGLATSGPDGDNLGGHAHSSEIALPTPGNLPAGEGELWGYVQVGLGVQGDAVISGGYAEQTWITDGGNGEEGLGVVLTW